MKRVLIPFLLVLLMLPTAVWCGSSPIKGGGDFGLGLVLGDPGTWGVTGKFWIDRENALQPAVKFGGGVATLQMDYLWHAYDLFNIKNGKLPLFFGAGGDLIVQNIVAAGARGVVGLSYLFDREDVPVDIFVQVAPTLWFFNGGTSFYIYGELGGRYYF